MTNRYGSYVRRLAALEDSRTTVMTKAPVPSWLMSMWRERAEKEGIACDEASDQTTVPAWLIQRWRYAGLTSTGVPK